MRATGGEGFVPPTWWGDSQNGGNNFIVRETNSWYREKTRDGPNKKYNNIVKDIYLDSYTKAIEDTKVLYFDFTYDMMFTEDYFQNALFLNKKGAQLFTKELIEQLGRVIPSS